MRAGASAARAGAGPFLLTAVPITALGLSSGGYFPETWGWSALGLLATVVAMTVTARRLDVSRAAAAFVAAVAALVGWTALSLLWTDSVSRTVHEVERGILYLAAAGAFALAGPAAARALAGGAAAASTALAVVSLGDRLLGDDATPRLAGPIGYWNSLGIAAAIGTVLSVAVAAEPARRARHLAAGATAALVPTLYLTYSRGSWIALALGLVVALALTPDRLRAALTMVVLSAPAAVGVAAVASLGDAGAAGVVVATAFAACVGPALVDVVHDRAGRAFSSRAVAAAARVAAAGAAVGVALALGPGGTATRAYERFTGPAPAAGPDGRSVLSASGAGRHEYWSVAWAQFRERPLTGTGAGTFDIAWHRERATIHDARDAHSFYVETLGELGAAGLALAALLVAIPLAAAAATRTHLGSAAAAAFAAFATHAAIDWDWEMPAVTVAGLACAVASVGAAGAGQLGVGTRRRVVIAVASVAAAAFASVAYAGNIAAARSAAAFDAGRYVHAATEARRAARWLRWSGEPWRLRGDAELAAGQPAAARASYARGIELDPLEWRHWLGLALASRGRARELALSRAAQLNPLAREVLALVPRTASQKP